MKQHFKRLTAWLLILTMVLGSNTAAVFAEELGSGSGEEFVLEEGFTGGETVYEETLQEAFFEEDVSNDPAETSEEGEEESEPADEDAPAALTDAAPTEDDTKDKSEEGSELKSEDESEDTSVEEREDELPPGEETGEEPQPEQEATAVQYSSISADAAVYADAELSVLLGSFREETVVAVSEGTDVYARIHFAVEGELRDAYVHADALTLLEEYEEESPSLFYEACGLRDAAFVEAEWVAAADMETAASYAAVPAGTSVYEQPDEDVILGVIEEAGTVRVLEEVNTEDAVWLKVSFALESGEEIEGFIRGEELELTRPDGDSEPDGNGVPLPLVVFTPRLPGSTDGLWVYELTDGYAKVLGYLDYEVTGLSIPDQLGGCFVNAIGEKAFVKNTRLSELYVHGNVVSIAEDAFAGLDVTLSGYNGTAVLRYAQEQGLASRNRTQIDYFTLADAVVDYSYAEDGRYTVISQTRMDMNAAEAAQLKVGSIFYLPVLIADEIYAWKVQEISYDGSIAHITVDRAAGEESITRIELENAPLTADWSRAVWADGVALVEEKGWFDPLELGFDPITLKGDFIKLKYELPIGGSSIGRDASGRFFDDTSWKFFLDGSIAVSASASFKAEVSLSGFELKDFKVSAVPEASFKLGVKYGDNNMRESQKTLWQQKDGRQIVGKKDYWLCSVPLVSAGGVVSVALSFYWRLQANGEIVITTGLSGEIGVKYNYSTGEWEKINTLTWKKPEIDASVTLEFGPKLALEVRAAFLGKVVSLDVFGGLVLEADAAVRYLGGSSGTIDFNSGVTTSTPDENTLTVCADIKLSLKASISLSLELELLKKKFAKEKGSVSMNGGFDIFSISAEWPWFTKHWELDKGWLEKCSYTGKHTVSFDTKTATKLEALQVDNNSLIDEPDIELSGTRPEGWYTDKACQNKWNFATDRVDSDLTLYAKWNLKVYTVTFDFEIHQETREAMHGLTISRPQDPMRLDYRFAGWYHDQAFTTPWNFTTDTITADTTIYGKWTADSGYDPYGVNSGGNVDTHGMSYDVEYNGHKYKHIMTYMSYAEAERYAQSYGGYLMTIQSKAEQDILARYVNNDCAQTWLWLGITDKFGWDFWSTGEEVTYTNWQNGKPNTSATQYNGVMSRTGGYWSTLSNTETAHFVIEWGAPTSVAQPNQNTDIRYTKDAFSKTAKVTGYTGQDESIRIEDTYDGYPVTAIESEAFKDCTTLKYVELPQTLKTIGAKAFSGCTGLQLINLPDSVTEVGESCFYGCTGLGQARWSSNTKTIKKSVFYNASSLDSITNIQDVTSILENCFYGCTKLSNVVFPAGLTTIGSYAFYNCRSLRDIILPNSLTTLYKYAFSGCSGAAVIMISDRVTTINEYTFSNCSGVTDTYIPGTVNKVYDTAFNSVGGTFHVYQGSPAHTWAQGRKTVDLLGNTYRVDFVTYTDGGAAGGTGKDGEQTGDAYISVGSRITEPVVEKDGMTIEGWYLDEAFTQPWDFALDKMPAENITLFAKWVENSDLFSYTVSNSKATITYYKGRNYHVVVPEEIKGYQVTAIAEEAFVSDSIGILTLPGTVKSISESAFNCPNLTQINIQGSRYYRTDDYGVVYNASGSKLVYVPQGLRLSEYTIRDGTTQIFARAFLNQATLRKVFIPDSVTKIAQDTFEGVPHLTVYGGIGACAAKTFAEKYNYSYNLYKVRFYYGNELVYDILNQAGSIIADYYRPSDDFSTFGGWYKDTALTRVWDFDSDVMPQNDVDLYLKWDTLFAVSVNNREVTVTGYTGDANDIVIPDKLQGYSVTAIAFQAFNSATCTSVTIPQSVVTIEDGAVADHIRIIGDKESAAHTYALSHGLTFTQRVYTISFETYGGSAVAELQAAPGKTVVLPTPVKDGYIFNGWYPDTGYEADDKWTADTVMPNQNIRLYAQWLQMSTIDTAVYSYQLLRDGTIEITAYSGSKLALSIPETINGYTVSRIGEFAFKGNRKTLSVTVPGTVTSIGEGAFEDSVIRVVNGTANVTVIGDCAFMNAGGLYSFTFGETLEVIGSDAFRGTDLAEFHAGSGLRTIGDRAFYGCEYLDTVVLNEGLRALGDKAFCECARLAEATIPSFLTDRAQLAFDPGVSFTLVESANIRILDWSVNNETRVTLSWNGVADAAQYVLARKTETVTKLTRWSTYYPADVRQATVNAGQLEQTAEIVVIACDKDKKAICQSEPIVVYLSTIATPGILEVVQTGEQTAQMRIEKVRGANGYELERSNEPDGEFTHLKNVTVGAFTNTGLVPGWEYYYRLRAYKTVDGEKIYSRYSDVYYFHMPYKFVTAPEKVTARQTALKTVKVEWLPVAGADGYLVYRSKDGADFTLFAQTVSNVYNNTGVANGHRYEYKVCAYFIENEERIVSEESEAASLTVRSITTPEITRVSQFRTNVVKVTWSAVADAAGYMLYRSNSREGTYKRVKTVSATEANDLSSITIGATYYYKVCAYKLDEEGNQIIGELSPEESLTINAVATVEGLTAVQNASGGLKASWGGISDVEGYELWLSANVPTGFELYADIAEKTVNVTGLQDGVTYYLAVCAYSTIDGEKQYGLFSDFAELTILGAPEIQVLEQEGSKAARLIWTKVESADGYEIWRQDGPGASYKLWRTLSGTQTLNSSLSYNTLYGYKIRSYKTVDGAKQYSPYSEVKKIRLLDAPTLSKIVRSDTRAATLSWTKVSGAAGYDVYRSNEEDGIFTLWKTVTELTATNSSLTVGSMYFYKVIPYCEVNGVKQQGKPSAVKGIYMLPTPKITGIETVSSSSVKVSWDEVEGASGYKLLRDTAEDGSYGSVKKVTTLDTKSSNLTVDTRYYFKVVAYAIIDGVTYESLPSAVKSVYFVNLAKPAFKSVEQPSPVSVTLAWSKVNGAAGYELVRSDTEDGVYKSVKSVAETSATNTSLKAGGTYYYRVRAYRQISDTELAYGIFSDPIAVTLLAAPKIASVERIGSANAKVTWNAVDNATAYKLYRSTEVDGTYKVVKTVEDTSYNNGGLTVGTQYYYKVCAVYELDGLTVLGPKSPSKNVILNELPYTKITYYVQNGDGTVVLQWNAVEGAEGYEVSRADDNGVMSKVKNTNSTRTTITGLANGSTYTFRVRMYTTVDGSRQYGGYSTSVSLPLMDAPVILSATHTSPTEVLVSWRAVEGATSYSVYQKQENGSYKLAGTTEDTSLTCGGLKRGVPYLFKVVAVRTTTSQTNKSAYSGECVAYIMESAHNYKNNTNQTWSLTLERAASLELKFSAETKFESGYDKLYITDVNGNSVGSSPYSGTSLAGAIITVPGDTVNLQMTTDGSVTFYGFAVEYVKAVR